MPLPKSQLLMLAAIVLMVIGGAYYWLNLRETPDSAVQKLAAQNIEVSPDSFFEQIKVGNADTIHDFIKAGATAGTLNDAGTSGLMVAVQTGNAAVVSQLLTALPKDPQGASGMLNLQDTATGKTALVFAAEKGNADIVALLLQSGADTALSDKTSQTPLIGAIANNHPAILGPLIAADAKQHAGAELNNPNSSGDTPLIVAIRSGSQEMLDTLLAAKADAVTADRSGVTPLLIAAETGVTATGEKLIAAGAKPDTADRLGNTPLTNAIRHSHPEFAQLLLSKGADPDFHTTGQLPLQAAVTMQPFNKQLFVYLISHSKQTAAMYASLLFDAIDHKNTDLAMALILHDNGANAKAVNANGETLLYHAIENGLEEPAVALLDKGADVNQTGVAGVSPLERATKHNEIKVVQKLLALGASPDQKTADGYTLAEMSVYSGYPEILDALLAKNAKLEKDFGILWSIRDGGGRSVPVLLKYGAHSNVMSNSGDPALWLAASAGETEAVSALIRYHAAIDFPNVAQGMTPLAIASHGGQLAVVKLLVEAGAKIEAQDANGMTALAQAAYMAKPDVVAYLLSKGAKADAADKQGRTINDIAALGQASADRDKVIAMLQHKN